MDVSCSFGKEAFTETFERFQIQWPVDWTEEDISTKELVLVSGAAKSGPVQA